MELLPTLVSIHLFDVRWRMKNMKVANACVVVTCAFLLAVLTWYARPQVQAEDSNKFVGSEACAACHPDVSKKWALTSHRRTLTNKDAVKNGCESCHGPGEQHIAGGGDKTKISNPKNQKPKQIADMCMKCHKQEHVTLWASSTHARAKVTCLNCHDPHSPETAMMSKDIENGTNSLQGLAAAIKQAELAVNDAAVGSEDRTQAESRLAELKKQADDLREKVNGTETAYKRVAEPYICYTCHKAQQVQSKMPSHHPIAEGKMKCSDCHNPHGGAKGMLKAESVNETCYKCHAEKSGPFTFEHPPVSEDCTNCHSPHGSVQNKLLTQSQPFLCLKCHAGPHSRSGTLGKPASIPEYYTECTDCHAKIHGSDNHIAFHY